MAGRIVIITYKLDKPRADYIAENLPYAQPISEVPGLRWKIWIMNEEQREAGGVYLFEDQRAAQAFLDGEIIAEMKGDPSLAIRSFDTLDNLTATTRGPIR